MGQFGGPLPGEIKSTDAAGDRPDTSVPGLVCYHRDRPGSAALRNELLEEHWSYMDRYATEIIARGPTFASDGDTPTGSVYVVDLPDPAAARAFTFDELTYQAGVYRDVLLRPAASGQRRRATDLIVCTATPRCSHTPASASMSARYRSSDITV